MEALGTNAGDDGARGRETCSSPEEWMVAEENRVKCGVQYNRHDNRWANTVKRLWTTEGSFRTKGYLCLFLKNEVLFIITA